MTLADYLREKGLTHEQFAQELGCKQPTVSRFVAGRIPSPNLMEAITGATNGAVQPNDFYDLSA